MHVGDVVEDGSHDIVFPADSFGNRDYLCSSRLDRISLIGSGESTEPSAKTMSTRFLHNRRGQVPVLFNPKPLRTGLKKNGFLMFRAKLEPLLLTSHLLKACRILTLM